MVRYHNNLKEGFCTIWNRIVPAYKILPLPQRDRESENLGIKRNPSTLESKGRAAGQCRSSRVYIAAHRSSALGEFVGEGLLANSDTPTSEGSADFQKFKIPKNKQIEIGNHQAPLLVFVFKNTKLDIDKLQSLQILKEFRLSKSPKCFLEFETSRIIKL